VLRELTGDVSLDAFRLPLVIVVGSESTGKSSLLEKITKYELFPRNSGICTKMPIRFEMIHTQADEPCGIRISHGKFTANYTPQEILPALTEYMGNINAIMEEEMLVEIRTPHVMTFTVLDLPGLRSFPPDMAHAMSKIAHNYLSDKDALVLCIAPVTDPRLTSSAAIGMVMECGRQAQTILALTMPDRVRSADFKVLVVDRLLNLSDEIRDCGFVGCVAVKNRQTSSDVTLQQSDAEEATYFEKAMRLWAESDPSDEVRRDMVRAAHSC
jgi:dynamin 1-like protein